MPDQTIKNSFYYKHISSPDLVMCGECWNTAIDKTMRGEFTGDEQVYASQLEAVDQNEPWQCDGCLVQNEAYELLGEDD